MQRIVIISMVAFCAVMIVGCKTGKEKINIKQEGENVKPVYFERLVLSINNMTAQNSVYEVVKTDGGVHMEYYNSYSEWSEEENDYVEQKDIIKSVDGDEKMYEEVAALCGKCGIEKWDGFAGHNNMVLDGTTMSFSAVLSDGKSINACGNNKFPKGYSKLSQGLYTMIME